MSSDGFQVLAGFVQDVEMFKEGIPPSCLVIGTDRVLDFEASSHCDILWFPSCFKSENPLTTLHMLQDEMTEKELELESKTQRGVKALGVLHFVLRV